MTDSVDVAQERSSGPAEAVDAVFRRHDDDTTATPDTATPPASATTAGGVDISVIMPTVSWTGSFAACGRRVLTLLESSTLQVEFIVAFDGPAVATPVWLERDGVRILSTGRRSGPATARNLAANAARGRILFFVDADVELSPEAIEHVATAFSADPDLAAIFGTYDDEPAADGVVSQYRNLLHHHTHVRHPGPAATFWSGCGAIRSSMFLDVGGFDEDYALPCIEDIELGMRICSHGGKIVLDPDLRCKHLKQWTFPGMVVADVFHRAKPWTQLIMQTQQLPVTLNLDWKGRVSGVLSLILAASLLLTLIVPLFRWPALAAAFGLLLMNLGFYNLCLRKGGIRFAASSFALHSLYFLYSTITFVVVAILELIGWSGRSTACHSLPSTAPVTERDPRQVNLAPPAVR